MYVTGNPVRYSDPTGLFTDDQIKQFLKDQYGDKWHEYLDVWKSDKVFWEMLLKADYGDSLFSYSERGLLEGRFIEGTNDTFDFIGYNKLEEYQGYGPYHLVDERGNTKIDHPQTFELGVYEMLIYLAIPKEKRQCRQPLYSYSEDGPKFTGFYRVVYYNPSGMYNIDWNAGDSVPYWIGGSVGLLGLAALFPPAAPIAEPLGIIIAIIGCATTVNNAIRVQFEFWYELEDVRTYLRAP